MSTMNGYSETEKPRKWYTIPEPGEEVVLTGIAGRFPESDNMRLFQQNLMNKMDLITNDGRRWKLDHPEIPQRTGKINNVEKFDALFFGVHFKQAHTMDPMCRMLLEHTYEAIVDAGINPRQLRGTRTGVFIGACFSESEKTWFYEKLQVNGFGITGCSRAMLANRISYWLGLTGPSYTVDSACSSSLFALEHAYRAIRNGQCDAALVGGSNLCLHPYVSLQFSRLGVLSPDGRCKSFDADANGYVRSETIAVVFLQKAKDSKRIYATLVHGKTNCDGYKEQGITFPSSVMQSQLFKEFYDECGIPPTSLNFMEAHGTGTRVGDPEEINAIDKIFCEGRTTPLKIGSIKSNLGHTEPASGLCSIAKVILAMESGVIPPNLHYNRPREGVKPLEEGRMVVISEPTPWELGYVGVNSFGFGGANAHILLKSNEKEKINGGAPKDDLPRLVVVSGRTEEAVVTLLNDIESRPIDVEYISLFHNIHSEEIPGHIYRGYTVVGNEANENRSREIENFSGAKRPLWYVFSGMGSQWTGMGEAFMKFPVFAKAIAKCDAVLKPHGVDIYKILTSKDKSIFDNILNSFVGIAAIQIGLVDLLFSVGITPDYIIGHSVGELGCAYADGCFTAEQMVLSAYSRGLASIETKVIRGSMAAVGLGYEDLKELCPPDIEIACHNGPDSATISGPADSMKEFVAKLQAKKIFAKEVPCSNIPYHSRYIAAAGPKLLAYLKKVIPEPKVRSEKWLSTSVPRSEWSTAASRLSSAEYHTNNLLSPVLFEETAMLIPKDAVTIEIAPHGLLQAILKRSLPETVKNIALTHRSHRDNAEVFLQGLGKLYNNGFHPNIATLYPPVTYPVSRGTPMISPLIRWEHTDDWYVTSYKMQEKISSGERIVEVSLQDEDYEYISGHVIDGRNLFPATGYLALVWETLGMMMGQLYSEVSVIMEDVKFNRATTVSKDGKVEFTVMIQKGSGKFEVVEGGAPVVNGMIRATTNLAKEKLPADFVASCNDDEDEPMTTRDIYKELKLRGYQYSGFFRGLHSAAISGNKGHIEWRNNWVAFMDNMLQMQILGIDTRGLFVPTAIRKLVIDTKTHLRLIRSLPTEKQHISARVFKEFDAIVAGGVEIFGAQASAIPRKKVAGDPVLEQYRFVAHCDNEVMSLHDILRISTHIALENRQIIKVKTVELIDENEEIMVEQLASSEFSNILGDLPLIQANINLAAPANKFKEEDLPNNVTVCESKKIQLDGSALIAIGPNLLNEQKNEQLKQLLMAVRDGGFLITRETGPVNECDVANLLKRGLDLILKKRTEHESLLLFKKKDKIAKSTVVIHVNNDEFSWLKEVQNVLNNEETNAANVRAILVGEGDFDCGLLGFVNCLMKEPSGEVFKAFLIQDPKAPKFSLENPLYEKQLELDLAINVLRSGATWGSYRHMPLPPLKEKVVEHAIINQGVRGDLSSIHWIEGPLRSDCDDPNFVHITYAPLNFRDVMLTTGKLAAETTTQDRRKQDCVIGFEYVGVDRSGRRVMGICPSRCLSNYIITDKDLQWEIPQEWSLEDAATVPTVYSTCYYALYINGQMKKGDKVLIHAGTGGVGQAAINLALHEGCEVFTTVGTPDKRRFIREMFPSIPDDHIGNSRDTSFEQMIMKQTNGRGVDIVLNSLAEEKLQASIRCLAIYGRFLEIGKVDFVANNPLGLQVFMKSISFQGIMLDRLFSGKAEIKKELFNLLQKGLISGAVKPLTRNVFSQDQVETALRYMAAGKHVGKVIIKIHDEKQPFNAPMVAYPRYYCLNNASYVILGGLGGFGMELADWLIIRGAQNLVLTSRNGVKNGYQRMRVELWKSYGVNVSILVGYNASKREDCEFILKTAKNLGPVDGIFNLAVVLKDMICKNQTAETFAESFTTKAWATKQLDEVSRKLCPQLRHFVVFSSVSCGRGNPGQTNYGMANSVMERICEKRVEEGLPGLAVQWGAVGDVGLVADMQENDKELVIGGTLQQRITSCLRELDGFLMQSCPVVASMVVAEKRAGGSGANNVVDTVLNIMGVKDLKTVSQHTPLAELGMDSMMAVEIKQTLEREYEIYLTAQDIRSLNFAKLAEMASKEAAKNENQSGNTTEEVEKIAGMKLFLRLVGKENFNSDPILKLQTKAEEGRNDVFLIPGIEGFGQVFKTVAPNIKSPATCLQLALRSHHKSIEEMAAEFVPHVLATNKGRRDFLLVGYSFGTLVAIELTRQLEAQGLTGRLILIDGSPDQMKMLKNQHIYSTTEEELQSNVILGVMDVLHPVNSAQLVAALGKCNTWEEKLNAFFSLMPIDNTNDQISSDKPRTLILALYKRLCALSNYNPNPMPYLRTPITLLKPTLPAVVFPTEDYNLKKLTREKVEVYLVEGNHITMLDNPKIALAVNGEPLEDAETFKATIMENTTSLSRISNEQQKKP